MFEDPRQQLWLKQNKFFHKAH